MRRIIVLVATCIVLSCWLLTVVSGEKLEEKKHQFKPSSVDAKPLSQVDNLFNKYSNDGERMNSTQLHAFLLHFVDLMRGIRAGRTDHNSMFHGNLKDKHDNDHSHDDHDHEHHHDHDHEDHDHSDHEHHDEDHDHSHDVRF